MNVRGTLRKKIDWFPYMLTVPTFLLLVLVIIVPIVKVVQMSLSRYVLTDPAGNKPFVGLDNYAAMIVDGAFWYSIWISLQYTIGTVVFAYALGLGFALLLNKDFPLRQMMRSLVILPWATPYVAAVLIWLWVFEPQSTGILNWMLMNIGVTDAPQRFLLDRTLVMPSLITVNVWKEFPFAMIMLLAGLQTIPRDLYEAAAVDGGTRWQQFRYITLPSLRFVNRVVILLLAIWSFKQFTIIHLMTGGGPGNTSEALIIKTYNQAFSGFDMGYASTLGVASLVISKLFCIVYLYVTGRKEGRP